MNKLEALTYMQELIGKEYQRLEESYHEACRYRDWYTCDYVTEKKEVLKDLYNVLEKEFRGD